MSKYKRLKRYQNIAFYTAHRLTGSLGNNGLSQVDLWNYVRKKYHAESRWEMTVEKWIELVAELEAARIDSQELNELCERIKNG